MSNHDWRSARAANTASTFVQKVRKFGLTPLCAEGTASAQAARMGFLEAGSWALQNPAPIMTALKERRSFSILVGMRPGSRLHLGHLSLIRELDWLVSQGGEPLILFAAHEASTGTEINVRTSAFFVAYEGLTGRKLPMATATITDSESPELLALERDIADAVTVKEVLRVYGWDPTVSVNRMRTATMTAAAFLHLGATRPEKPCIVLSDVLQVTHAEITRAASSKLGYSFPTISYRHLLPSLKGPSSRMTIHDQRTTIFLGETEASAATKLKSSFTGGQSTIEEQRVHGGEPMRCSFFHAAETLQSVTATNSMHDRCVSGQTSCGDCKKDRIPVLVDRLRLTANR